MTSLVVMLVLAVLAMPVAALATVLVLWGRLARARTDIDTLSARIDSLERRRVISPQPAPIPQPDSTAREQQPTPAPAVAPAATEDRGAVPQPARPEAVARPAAMSPEPSLAGSDAAGDFYGFNAWLFGGNTVVRAGAIVLLFGVAFFLNYAIDQGWLPVEVRLSLAAAGGLALTAVGWRLRDTRRDYALVLQGGGIGIVYLTVFAAVNLYNLMSTGPGLALMVVLVALSSALAVLQDARSLAILATLGGFLAPVLVSRGGSHVALFSYYAVLDAGILAIAWFKAWKLLNRLGFVCTFIIGALWGGEYYQPAYFASTEPFLVAFFLFYVAVPVLFAKRQQATGTHDIDASLLFGVPLVAFGLQAALVRDFEYGLAFSALAAGIFYIALASALWRRLQNVARILVEVFLALGVGFGTIAIPLAFDGRWTGSAWALEGAGLIWVGVRQRRQLARVSGLCLQVAAGISLLLAWNQPNGDLAVLNSVYLGALLVSLGGLFSAWYLDRHRQELEPTEADASVGLLAWGLLWWGWAGFNEISTHVPNADQESVYLVFAAGSAVILALLRRPLAWRHLSFPLLLLLPVMAVIALGLFSEISHPLVRWGSVAWAMALAAHYWIQWRLESEWPDGVARYWHQGMLWLVVFLVSWEAGWLMERLANDASTWRFIAWALIPGATIVSVPALTRRWNWPFQRFADAYMSALIPVVTFVGFWVLFTSATRGNPAPLAYVPLVNPLELAQCLILAIILHWTSNGRTGISEQTRWFIWSILAFAVLNGMIARATHFYSGVDFNLEALWSSPSYQTAVSIVWTLAALVTMVSAAWLKQRAAWFVGAALLAAVVAKLFLVDLDDVGTVARIVSFVGVGLLMLLVGYVSPLPPRPQEQGQS
jgi:uncharacterized membrane protein